MRKLHQIAGCVAICIFLAPGRTNKNVNGFKGFAGMAPSEWEEAYDDPLEKEKLEFEKTKDPALGYVPQGKLLSAMEYTESMKVAGRASRVNALSWTERGPIYDSVGPSNGNTRGGNGYTSGLISAILVDTLNDPTGNTVFCGGSTGGLWRCTNFLSAIPNWTKINDFNENLAVQSICQDPTSSNTLYYSTGDAVFGITSNYGAGVWKSTDGGLSWSKLPTSANFLRSFKIMCDASGNVYLAVRATTIPIVQPHGLFRSSDKGASWIDITPTALTSSNTACTDIEISSTGRLHASFGWEGTIVNHWYTDIPSTVSTSSGWNMSTGIRSIASPPAVHRMELTCQGNVLYAITVNSSDNADSCYKSIDGGATWTKQNTTIYPTGVLNNQGYYDITLSINPSNSNEFILAGLDAYKSTNSGATCNTRMTYWITNSPYVHADHHFMQWWNVGAESRIVIGCDGGIFLSRDGGATFTDKNRNLSIKQFYSGAIHPDAASPYLLAGAQDNGTHQLTRAGLSYSTEVTGGDGMFVHINQQDPSIQFGSYVYNQYRRSIDGGQTWQYVNISTNGLFTNPYDLDDGQNILYACNGTNAILRWKDANTSNGSLAESIVIPQLNGSPSAFLVSPYTKNRVFVGSNGGKLARVDNANAVTSATVATNVTDITGAAFPAGFLNAIAAGSSDNVLVAVFTNFGVNNVWYSTDGGTSWAAIDGNLPDMPVRWALIDPQHDDRIYIATGAGIYHTDLVNGGSTVWAPETGFPTVRTDMLKLRLSDNTMVAATYGRGLFTAVIPSAPEIRFSAPFSTVSETAAGNNLSGCRYYKDYTLNVSTVAAPTGDATVTYTIDPGNTATRGLDFDFTTNGDFTTPSNQHVFTSGVAQTKVVTVRVYDDAEVEGPESFTLRFSVSGTTNAFAGSAKSVTVTINDNDVVPFPLVSGTKLIGTPDFNAGNNADAPVFNAKIQTNRAQMVYKASELSAAGMTAGSITSVAFNLTKNSVRPYKNLQIRMNQTSLNYLVSGGTFSATSTFTVKTLSTYSTISGWNVFTLDAPFDWDGVSNVAVEVCYDNVTADNTDFADAITLYNDPAAIQTQGNFIYQNGITCGIGFSSVFYYFYGAKPQMKIEWNNKGAAVGGVLNASRTEYLGPNVETYFYSSAGVLLARIKNLGSFDYGCTQVVIDRAGNGASQFWNNNTANYLMNKTFHVVPTNNNSLGQYEMTLYYSQAEKTGWEAATGQSWNNIQFIKVNGQVNQVSPANPHGAGSVQTLTPVRATYGNDYTLTYVFNDGFSGFGAGVAGFALPVGLLDFTGRLYHNSAELKWKTSFEMNSRGFDVERSYDGHSYTKIGFVQAAGNSAQTRQYSFTDKMIAQENNYYRLKQVDLDDHYEYSKVILIRAPMTGGNSFRVLRNPFAESIDIQFAHAPGSRVYLQMFSSDGKWINSWDFEQMMYSRLRVDVSNQHLSKGIYILHVYVNGQEYVERLMKE